MQALALSALAFAILALAWVLWRRERARALGRRELLDAIEAAARGAVTSPDVLEMAETTLRPLTRAFSPADGVLALWTLDPPREGKVEGHAPVRWRPFDLPGEIAEYLSVGEGAIRVEDLERRTVREPRLRPVFLHLKERGVAVFVPAVADGESQGALLVPAPLGGLRIDGGVVAAFEEASRWIAPQLAHFAAQARTAEREVAWVLERRTMRAALDRERARARDATSPTRPTFVARSDAMQALLGEVDRAAESDGPILLEAAAGAGAGRVARAIHAESAFSEGPFIERDARRLRSPDLRPDGVAAGGTLFVRDVVVLSGSLVEPLLEAVATRAYRLVVTTRVDLLSLASDGRFDSRLWELLRGGLIRVPALAERGDDLPELATIRLREQAVALARPEIHLAPRALEAIMGHPWPGNVPELDRLLADAISRTEGSRIEARDLRLPAEKTPTEPKRRRSRKADTAGN